MRPESRPAFSSIVAELEVSAELSPHTSRDSTPVGDPTTTSQDPGMVCSAARHKPRVVCGANSAHTHLSSP